MGDGDGPFVKGTCMQMCPEKEILMREREGILHKLEMLAGTENDKKPKADRNKVVKSFSRSAAGQNISHPSMLRPPEVLLQTVNYLLHDVISINYMEYYKIYDFIMDRIRAVRQDMVIQNLERPYCISLLQPIIRFYAYSAYWLCEEKLSNFEPAINNKHLQECLKRLLCFYDECDQLQNKYTQVCNKSLDDYSELFAERPYMESLYLLFNLGDSDALLRILNLHKRWRVDVVNYCLELSLCYRKGNWVRTCTMIRSLPGLLQAVAALHLNKIRKDALLKMSYAYNSKTFSFPIDLLRDMLLYNNSSEVVGDLIYYNLTINEKKKTVYFVKSLFDKNKDMRPLRRSNFVDDTLMESTVSDIILYGI